MDFGKIGFLDATAKKPQTSNIKIYVLVWFSFCMGPVELIKRQRTISAHAENQNPSESDHDSYDNHMWTSKAAHCGNHSSESLRIHTSRHNNDGPAPPQLQFHHRQSWFVIPRTLAGTGRDTEFYARAIKKMIWTSPILHTLCLK
jgi:hypothetical protein